MTLALEMTAEDVKTIVEQVADTMLQDQCPIEMGKPPSCGVQTRCYEISLTRDANVIDLGLTVSENCAMKLAQHLTGKLEAPLAEPLVDDVMKEWLNIMAGQVKSFCALDHKLGIPQRCQEAPGQALPSATYLSFSNMGVNMIVSLTGATLKAHNSLGGSNESHVNR